MNPPELEKLGVTEIMVRMDCNGRVQKIKKALHGIGEHTNQQAQPTEAAPGGTQPPTESANPPPPADTSTPAEPQKDPPPSENPTPEEVPPPPATEAAPPASQPQQSSGLKEVEEVHVIYHHSPDYDYRYSYGPSNQKYGGQQSSVTNAPGVEMGNYPVGLRTSHQTPPIYVSHNYNTYKPSPQYVHYSRTEPAQSYSSTEPLQHVNYSRPELPPQDNYNGRDTPKYMHYSKQEPPQYSYYSTSEPQKHAYYTRPEQYNEDYHNGNGNIASVFSDENPNACTIV